ncbi:hypothetical protein J1614_005012 [Plenodomus biglobosus]|nr:hypothetical protein J1614_005012 [Plenodomus biglobosus]
MYTAYRIVKICNYARLGQDLDYVLAYELRVKLTYAWALRRRGCAQGTGPQGTWDQNLSSPGNYRHSRVTILYAAKSNKTNDVCVHLSQFCDVQGLIVHPVPSERTEKQAQL